MMNDLLTTILIIYLGLSLLVSFLSLGRRVSFVSILIISLLMTPVAGLITALRSDHLIRMSHHITRFACPHCHMEYTEKLHHCPHCAETGNHYSLSPVKHLQLV